MTVDQDLHLASRIVLEAADLLRREFPRTRSADKRSEKILLQGLMTTFPSDGFLSEESLDNGSRYRARRVWIIDPLDGSDGYYQGSDEWAIHVALVNDGILRVGLVYSALHNHLFCSDGMSTHLSRQWDKSRPLRIGVSRTHLSIECRSLLDYLEADIRFIGSAGVKAMCVVRGEVDAYIHSGGFFEWDVAAPACVAMDRGLSATTLDGEILEFNKVDPGSKSILIASREISYHIRSSRDEMRKNNSLPT